MLALAWRAEVVRPTACKDAMTLAIKKTEPVYYKLVIIAASPTTEIWLADDGGHLVQKEIGTLRTSLLPGFYTVEFGLGNPTYPIRLAKANRYTQADLAAGPTCPRPKVRLLPE